MGGASVDGGSGLRGLSDRLATPGGAVFVASPPGCGTTQVAEIPHAAYAERRVPRPAADRTPVRVPNRRGRRGIRIAVRRGPPDRCGVDHGNEIGWAAADAERAFGTAVRARRRASLARRVLRRCVECARLMVVDAHGAGRSAAGHGVRDVPVDAIVASLEPNRAAPFDSEFRPSPPARSRWLRVWLAEQRGAVLPPISLAPIGHDAYAIRDGHHRVSVARARGALTISATVA